MLRHVGAKPLPGLHFLYMFLLYADASGAADHSDVNTRHYVLLGLAVHEGTWFALDKRLNGLKAAYCQPGDHFELHAAEFACSIKEQDEIAGFAGMSWTDRRATVTAIRQAKIAAEPTAKARKAREKIYKRTESFIHLGHPWGRLLHVIDVPFFAASDRVCGLQLVDICAYAVRRYLDKNAVAGSHEERNFQRIFQRFDRDNLGRLHGLRHYVQAGTCGCLICQERGHAPASAPAAPTPPPAAP